ncbi:MAG: SDR family oxidoreductase [Planctomycetota bacterium]
MVEIELPGKVLILGGRTGIGRAVADWCGEQAIVWSRSTNGVDATDAESVRAATEEFLAENGAPWALVHSVGDFDEQPLLETSDDLYRHLLENNLTSAFLAAKALVPSMVKAGRGRVIYFGAAGVGDATAKTRAPIYFAIKAGLLSMVRSLAKEIARSGVTVNMVSPGIIRHAVSHAESQDRMESKVPLGRSGTVEDLRSAIEMLLSEGSGYLTGEDIHVDGGLRL